MEVTVSDFYGFEQISFMLGERKAIIVKPNEPREDKKWIFKTEYFGDFPEFEIEMLKNGYYVIYLQNKTRWYCPDDEKAKKKFYDALVSKHGFHSKCLLVGLGCGGAKAVYFASDYPECVSGIYLDAPVLNYLSCPLGIGNSAAGGFEEFTSATGITRLQLINFRDHPVDRIDTLIEHNIPVFMVFGDCDTTAPYDENGAILSNKYSEHECWLIEIDKGQEGHHPYGIVDPQIIVEWALAVDQ